MTDPFVSDRQRNAFRIQFGTVDNWTLFEQEVMEDGTHMMCFEHPDGMAAYAALGEGELDWKVFDIEALYAHVDRIKEENLSRVAIVSEDDMVVIGLRNSFGSIAEVESAMLIYDFLHHEGFHMNFSDLAAKNDPTWDSGKVFTNDAEHARAMLDALGFLHDDNLAKLHKRVIASSH